LVHTFFPSDSDRAEAEVHGALLQPLQQQLRRISRVLFTRHSDGFPGYWYDLPATMSLLLFPFVSRDTTDCDVLARSP
jgi:hypothetical protein